MVIAVFLLVFFLCFTGEVKIECSVSSLDAETTRTVCFDENLNRLVLEVQKAISKCDIGELLIVKEWNLESIFHP